jgi:FtsZ-binding cell division protein ZapB
MVDQPNPRMIMRGGMMLPEEMVRSNTPLIPTRQQENQAVTSQAVGVQPLSKRMSAAYDKFITKVEPEKGIQGKDAVALGRLLLEIEQVKNNLNSIAQEVTNANRKKVELDLKENELLEEETERLTALGASFRNFRRTAGTIAAALSGKQFLEGDLGGGFQNAAIAVTAFLPEIIKVVSTVVLGRMLLGGRGMGAARGVATGGGGRGGLLPMLLMGGGLLAAGSALGSRGGGDQRRFELTKRQAIPQLLSRNDVRRFRSSSTRFDNILTGLSGNNVAFRPKTALEVGEDIKEPKGFLDTAKDFGSGIVNFFKGDSNTNDDNENKNNNDEIASNIEETNLSESLAFLDSGKEFIVAPSSDFLSGEVASNSMFDESKSGENNIISVGGEDKQISNAGTEFPSSSNVYVKPTFSDNSKISYILEYGAGAVI